MSLKIQLVLAVKIGDSEMMLGIALGMICLLPFFFLSMFW